MVLDKTKITIDLLSPDYLDQILAIEKQVQINPWSQNIFQSCFSSDIYRVIGAMYQNDLIGYGILQLNVPEAEIQNFAVSKKLQKQAIGKYFLSLIFRYCQDLAVDKIMLEVRETNLPAIRLYQNNGFKNVGVRKGYYKTVSGTEAALLLARFLNRLGSVTVARHE